MERKADDSIRRMVYLKGVFSHPCYSNGQLVHNDTRSFIYADDLCIATQRSTFVQTETILTEALPNMDEYYKRNHLRANPHKTQTCAFHLKNRKAGRKLNITWYKKHLEHIPDPVYQGVTLDRTVGQKEHTHKLKCKTSARNNILRKLPNKKIWSQASNHQNNSSCILLLYGGIYVSCVGKFDTRKQT